MTLQSITDEILRHHVIPIIEIDSAENSENLADAILAGGISIIEITLRTDAALKSIEKIRNKFPEMLVAAGTVTTPELSVQARDAGAQFGIAPGLNPNIVASFHASGHPFIPGAITPSEIESALAIGCSLLKFFPARHAGGPDYLRELCGPFYNRDLCFCATGGIALDNMLSYLEIPIVNAVGGTWLASREQIANRDWQSITRQVTHARERLSELDR